MKGDPATGETQLEATAAVSNASTSDEQNPPNTNPNTNRDNTQSHVYPPQGADVQRGYWEEGNQPQMYQLNSKHPPHPPMESGHHRVPGSEYYFPREDYRHQEPLPTPHQGEYYPHPIPRSVMDPNPPQPSSAASAGMNHYAEVNRIPDETSSNANYPPPMSHHPHEHFPHLAPATPGRYPLYPPHPGLVYPSQWHPNATHHRPHSYPPHPHFHDPNAAGGAYYDPMASEIEPAPLTAGNSMRGEDAGYLYHQTGYPSQPPHHPYTTSVVPPINTQPSPQRPGAINTSPGPKSEAKYVSPTNSEVDNNVNVLKSDDVGSEEVNKRKRPLENPSSESSNNEGSAKRTISDRKQLQSQAWYDRFQELSEYKEKHGDCMVPQKYAPNPSLGIWVNKQRMEYKLLQDGEKSSMTPERLSALQSIGFVWAKRKGQATWDAKFKQLQEYKAAHGDCLIPTKYSKDPALGRWVSTQREQYRLWKSGDNRTKMNDTKIRLLESVGFVWRLQF